MVCPWASEKGMVGSFAGVRSGSDQAGRSFVRGGAKAAARPAVARRSCRYQVSRVGMLPGQVLDQPRRGRSSWATSACPRSSWPFGRAALCVGLSTSSSRCSVRRAPEGACRPSSCAPPRPPLVSHRVASGRNGAQRGRAQAGGTLSTLPRRASRITAGRASA